MYAEKALADRAARVAPDREVRIVFPKSVNTPFAHIRLTLSFTYHEALPSSDDESVDSLGAEREQIEKSAFAERERIEKSRIASFAANALYERRSRTFLVKLISRWRSLVVDARRRVGRLGDEMRSVLQKRRKYLLRFPKPKSSDGCFPTRD